MAKALGAKFAAELTEHVKAIKASGGSEEEATKIAEADCAQANEAFDPNGRAVVRAVYSGAEAGSLGEPKPEKVDKVLGRPEPLDPDDDW